MRISSKKYVGLEMSDNTSGISIDENLISKYNEKIIDYALKLKAQNGSKYSDEYYLDYAKNIYKMEKTKHIGEQIAKRAANCPIQDPQWRGYSYEEILNLENNGYKIPEEVLLWAHAQQESDIVAYEVISSEAELDDNTSTEEVTGDNELNNLQKKAKKYTTQAEKSEVEIKENIEKFNTEKSNITKKKQDTKNEYQTIINEISTITKEWKELEEKKQKESLTANEELKFKNLSKILGTKTTELENIKIDSNDINSLMESLDELKDSTAKNNTLTKNIDKATYDLANFDKNYNSEQKTFNTSGIVYSGNGLLSNLLFGADSSIISSIAFNTSNELSLLSTDSQNDIEATNISSLNTNEQAPKPVQQQIQNQVPETKPQKQNVENNDKKENPETEKTVTEKSEDSLNKNEAQKTTHLNTSNNNNTSSYKSNQNSIYRDEVYKDAVYKALNRPEKENKEENEKKSKNPNFFVLPFGGRPELALLAAATSVASTANLNNKKENTAKTEAKLRKDLTKTSNKIKKLEQQINTVEKKHAENLKLAEEQNANLEMLMAEEEAKQAKAETNSNSKSNITGEQNTTENNETTVSPAITSILDQMNSIYDNDQIMMINMAKPIAKAKSEIKVNDKTAKRLNEQNRSLEDRNSNNKKVQRNTIISGSMTTAIGAYNMAVAIPMLKTGTALLSSPFTAPTGAAMVALATKWIIISSLQLSVGPMAITAGGFGVAASKDANDAIKAQNKTYTDALKASQQNKKAIRLATNAMTKAEPTIIPEIKPNNNKKQQETNLPQEGNNKLATSKTQTMEFQDLKDISKMPKGPTNLSNPLNKPKSQSKTNSEYNEAETQKTEQQNTSTPKVATTEALKTKQTLNNKDKVNEILNKNINKVSTSEQIATLNKTAQEPEITKDEIQEQTNENEINQVIAKAQDELNTRTLTQKSQEADIDKKAEEEAIQEVQEEQQKEESQINTNILAASATANANIKSNILTDDKADRKLTRFNIDSIIESKKKQKKVNAMTSAYTGKRS